MAHEALECPHCGGPVKAYRNPFPTVDVVIELAGQGEPPPVVMVQRANPPLGWALPGGFVDYGESLERAARREAREETGLEVELTGLLGAYSRPDRDPRQHNVSVVYLARARGRPLGGSDAAQARAVDPVDPPGPLCFDHGDILHDYLEWRAGRRQAAPVQDREG